MNVSFKIVRSDDRELFNQLNAMANAGESEFACSQVEIAFLSGGAETLSGGQLNSQIEVLAHARSRVFQSVTYRCPRGQVRVRRHGDPAHQDNPHPFDIVDVNSNQDEKDHRKFSRLVAFAQGHLERISVNALNSYLGEDARRHFEARDIALARLETFVAQLTRELEDTRARRDREFDQKEKALESKFDERQQRLELVAQQRTAELDEREGSLNARETSLNLQAAKAERRQVRVDLKKKLKDWSEKFEITASTSRLRWIIHALCIVLLVVFAAGAGVFLNQSLQSLDTAQAVAVHIKQGAFTLLFVTTAIFYARWNTDWFRKRAAEEFRLKRMELDFDRASWLVELLFQWKDEHKDEPLPPELLAPLTAHLFASAEDQPPSLHPYEAVGSALLDAASRLKVSPGGAELELDRRGLRKLKKDSE